MQATKYPGISISLDESKVDITFKCGEVDEDKYTKQCLFKDTLILAVPEKFAKKEMLPYALSASDFISGRSNSVPFADVGALGDIPFILLRDQNNLHLRSLQIFREASIEPEIVQELDQLVTAYHFASQGIGATFVSSYLATAKNLPGV